MVRREILRQEPMLKGFWLCVTQRPLRLKMRGREAILIHRFQQRTHKSI